MPIEKVCEAISIDKESKISDFTENVQGIYRTNNDGKWIDINTMEIKDENGLLKGRILIIKDITEDKKKQEEIEYLSFYDQLTGLYNRRFFEEELRRLDTPRNLPISIVIADLNGLKLANDAFGHIVGDKLLVKMAEILKKSCRSDDIIARMGGDEFVVILPKTNVNEVECVVNRISSAVNDIKIHSVMLSVAIGWEIKRHKDESMEEVFKKAEDIMYRGKLFDSPSVRSKTVDVILNTLYQKNKIEEHHSHRVSNLCEAMGIELGFNDEEVRELKLTGSLHDIGKIAIDEKIINKPGRLNEIEWSEIKRHSEIGYRILSSVNYLSEIAEYVLAHHERWDGNGYPKGLKGEGIPIYSRIVSIADAFDTMISVRPYRVIVSKEDALKEIMGYAGTQFDPHLARVFAEKVIPRLFA